MLLFSPTFVKGSPHSWDSIVGSAESMAPQLASRQELVPSVAGDMKLGIGKWCWPSRLQYFECAQCSVSPFPNYHRDVVFPSQDPQANHQGKYPESSPLVTKTTLFLQKVCARDSAKISGIVLIAKCHPLSQVCCSVQDHSEFAY